ncbi:MAG TPA: signal peptide peptidase SppA [Bacteroidales bacterium]|nr:signal peptide peptidase SppA [Bacteroidales bacterium]HPJ58262.1 signal peptide peptidase SppA [Bacteroidales bacterium]HPR11593.1 signal peptide peptidase SppA [Bacteroidales bacterium]HRW85428.1 signal peptide peptidase SppA [Bacteroidales bacterium]
MKNFLIYTLATIAGIILASLLFFLIMISSLSIMVASGNKPVSIPENSVLVLNAGVTIPDRTDTNPFSGFDIMNMTVTQAAGLNDILKNLEKAADDEKIKGVLIENGLTSSGWATTEEVRNALINFREKSGKFVIAYSDYVLLQEGYYLSSVADKIYINPSSTVDFKGLSGEVMFYKKALEKVGVEVQVVRHGKFKGAVEPYMLDKMSDENRAQITDYVGSIWDHSVKMISESRGIPAAQLNRIADDLTGYISTGALESRLVDGLIYRDQLYDTIKIRSGLTTDDKINLVPMAKYTKVPGKKKSISVKNKISVIYASGSIAMGKGNDYNIGGNNYADIIRKERKDSSVKAIVLRVNSPGGNAIASDIIWRELKLAAQEKPVVISMGNYAASGGYFISAPGTKIYTNPTTITGSIGVFGLIPNAGKLLEQKVGIFTETVNTNKNSDFPSLFRTMEPFEKNTMQLSIEKVYADFVGKVAEGRKKTTESVDSIAQGRVWSGVRALELGLADEQGGLDEAIKGAALLAGLDSTCMVRELPAIQDPYTKLLNQLSGNVTMRLLRKELGEYLRFFNDLREISNTTGIQARMPYFIDIN